MARFRKMQWYESPEFARAKARAEKTSFNGKSLGIVALFTAICFALMDWPKNIIDLGVIILLSFTVALTISFILWIHAQAPKNVILDANGIIIGNDTTKLSDVDFAVIGKTMIGGTEFPVFSIQTTFGRSFVAGISSKINPTELADTLDELGVRVE
jgi:hypothetical protein